jgi:hypothetical protein
VNLGLLSGFRANTVEDFLGKKSSHVELTGSGG